MFAVNRSSEPPLARSKNGKASFMVSTPVLTAVVSLVGLAGVLTWRVREGRTAVTLKKIVMPPLGMLIRQNPEHFAFPAAIAWTSWRRRLGEPLRGVGRRKREG